jgi:hypothetical protein
MSGKFGKTPMRMIYLCVAALALASCGPTANQEAGAGSGVGFQDYQSYLRQREAALNGQPTGAVTPGTGGGFSTERIGSAIDAAGGTGGVPPPYAGQTGGGVGAVIGSGQPLSGQPLSGQPLSGQSGALDPNRPRGGDAPAGIVSQSAEVDPNNTGISDEQDFGAVTQRETIESDAERLARNRAQYEVIQPGALPERNGAAGANIVEFALSTSHAPGTKMYKRSGIGLSNPERTCARYGSPDLAQQAFLEKGGPEKDPKGIDPDGDGYACSWDPRPFRAN